MDNNRNTQKLNELFNQFVYQCRYAQGMRAATIVGYKATYELLKKLIPGICLEMLTPKIMTEFFARLQTRERKIGRGLVKKAVKNSTLLTYRCKLNTFFKWLYVNGHLKNDPFAGVHRPAVSYTDRKYLEREQVERILVAIGFTINWKNNLVKKRNLTIAGVLLHCGLRKGEMLNLKLSDINFRNDELLVRGEISKSRRDRIVPLNSAVIILLKDYLEERNLRKYTTPYLFVSLNRDERLSYDGYKHLVEKLNRECGVKFHTHQFRHTHSVNLLANGTDVVTIQQLLGHTDPRMTASYLRSLPMQIKRPHVEMLARLENL